MHKFLSQSNSAVGSSLGGRKGALLRVYLCVAEVPATGVNGSTGSGGGALSSWSSLGARMNMGEGDTQGMLPAAIRGVQSKR